MAVYKTFKRPLSFYQEIGADEEAANEVVIQVVEITSGEVTDDFLWVQQVKRAGIEIPGFEGAYDTASGTLTIADAGSVSLTSGDVLSVIGTFYG